jgi:hypothetical protein
MNGFLEMTSKAQTEKWDYIKLKSAQQSKEQGKENPVE